MMAKFADAAIARSTFDDASQVLGYDLWKLVSDGPADDLNATERTQPAMLAAGVATWRIWQERGAPSPRWSPAIAWASARRWSRRRH